MRGSHHNERIPPSVALGTEHLQGDICEGHWLQRRAEEPQQSQAQHDPNPEGMVTPRLGGEREGTQ